MMYKPNPLNCETVSLPDDLIHLTEQIAENVHDVWAAGRIAEGWKLGKIRNDSTKETPCLVPYNELPESEKEYDRATAISTIKLIIALGYKITKE